MENIYPGNSPKNIRFVRLEKGGHIATLIGASQKSFKPYDRAIVCIKEGDRIYKIISVISSKKDGSLNIFFPYFSKNEAYVYQFSHTYKGGRQIIEKSQTVKEYVVNRKTKLSIHRSGFVQLSGDGILSGIDPLTGKPKGIGVFSSPLDKPVQSGPTFVFQCWGLEQFEQLAGKKKDEQYIILNNDSGDFTKRIINTNDVLNTYILEFFIFPKEANKFVYEFNNELYIDHRIGNYLHNPGALFAHPVLDLNYFNGVLCVFPLLMYTGFTDKVDAGYILGSPGGSGCTQDKTMTGFNFHLICPREISSCMEDGEIDSLEFKT